MQVAEFFVSLVVKGGKKSSDQVEGVAGKLKGLGSMSLEAKAGLLAVLYGLEKMTAGATASGAGLVNFAASTGLSIRRLQEWKYAAQQASISGEEVEGSVKGLQTTMASMLQGGGAPKGLAMFADFLAKTGEAFDPKKARDMDYMIDRLQKFANSGPADIVKDKVMSFGVSEGMFTAMRRGVFNQKNYDAAPKYSNGEAKSLDQMNASFKNIWSKMEVGLGKVFAKDGPKLMKEIEGIIPPIMKLIGALMELAEKTKIFEWIGKSFEGWAMILNGVTDSVNDITKDKGGLMSGIKNKGASMWETTKDVGKWVTSGQIGADVADVMYAPPKVAGGGGGTTNNHAAITQNFNGPADPHKVRRASHEGVQSGINSAVRNSHAQKQRN